METGEDLGSDTAPPVPNQLLFEVILESGVFQLFDKPLNRL